MRDYGLARTHTHTHTRVRVCTHTHTCAHTRTHEASQIFRQSQDMEEEIRMGLPSAPLSKLRGLLTFQLLWWDFYQDCTEFSEKYKEKSHLDQTVFNLPICEHEISFHLLSPPLISFDDVLQFLACKSLSLLLLNLFLNILLFSLLF